MIDQRTVLITGANGGIGSAIVKKYLECGYNVIAHYHNSRGELSKLGNKRLHCIQADFSTVENIEMFNDEFNELYPEVDIVVNNAGRYSKYIDFRNVPNSDSQETYFINFLAPVRIIATALPSMIAKRWGRIVNISSIGVAKGGASGSFHYTASKAAIESFTKSIASDIARQNVLINSLRLGVTDTSIHSKDPTKDLEDRISKIPIGRMATTTEVAEFIYFFGSDNNTFSTSSVHTLAGGE